MRINSSADKNHIQVPIAFLENILRHYTSLYFYCTKKACIKSFKEGGEFILNL